MKPYLLLLLWSISASAAAGGKKRTSMDALTEAKAAAYRADRIRAEIRREQERVGHLDYLLLLERKALADYVSSRGTSGFEIVGGEEGAQEAGLRSLTVSGLMDAGEPSRADALAQSRYRTEDDALAAALAVIRRTGDPQQLKESVGPVAAAVYFRAARLGAYRGTDAADFDEVILGHRRRLAELSLERTRLAGAYDDPAKEFARRELVARGFAVEGDRLWDEASQSWKPNPESWRDAYIRYQKTPEYEFYIAAYVMHKAAVESNAVLRARNAAQASALQFAVGRSVKDRTLTPTLIAKHLEKNGFSRNELVDAVAFTMAWFELETEVHVEERATVLEKARSSR